MNKSNKMLLEQMGRALKEEGISPRISMLESSSFEPLKQVTNIETGMHQPIEHDKCIECGRKLVGRKARIRGMGKTCEKKRAARLQVNIFDQQKEDEGFHSLFSEILYMLIDSNVPMASFTALEEASKLKYKIVKR